MKIYRRVDIFTWLLKRKLLLNFNELELYDEKCALNAEKRQSPQVKFWKVDENNIFSVLKTYLTSFRGTRCYLIRYKALIGWTMALVVFILNVVIYKNPELLGFPNFDKSEDFQGERTRLFGWIFWIAGISFIFHSFGLRKLGQRSVRIKMRIFPVFC